MLLPYSIKDLYPLALAEGEGMGTAYEYYVKRKALGRFLAGRPPPRSILIAGLPEKYGASLDFLLLAGEMGAAVTVIDERPAALARLKDSIKSLADLPGSPPIAQPQATLLGDLNTLSAVRGGFELALSSETLQRLSPDGRLTYISRLKQMSPILAVFCPNAGNEAHNTHSGLGGLHLDEMRQLTMGVESPTTISAAVSGYIDMPPFPPGITRTAEQRDDATSGRFEAFVMWGLGLYSRTERLLPAGLQRRNSHIVYGFVAG